MEIVWVIFSVLLFKKSFVKAERPVVLILRPVQVVLEGVARRQSEDQPEWLVARVSPHLFSPFHLHALDDGSRPELSENFGGVLVGNSAPVLDPQRQFLVHHVLILLLVRPFLLGNCVLRIFVFILVSEVLISFVNLTKIFANLEIVFRLLLSTAEFYLA